MPERLNGAVSKTAISEKVSGVRIPLPPPIFTTLDPVPNIYNSQFSSAIINITLLLQIISNCYKFGTGLDKFFLCDRLFCYSNV